MTAPRRSKRPPINEAQAFDALAEAVSRLSGPAPERPNPFTLPEFPPGVAPADKKMAMDDAFGGGQLAGPFSWGAQAISSLIQEGESFLGYATLSEMALRPEYNQVCTTIAQAMTRKWIKLSSKKEGDKSERISVIKDELERLKVRENFRITAEQDGRFGRAHLYLDTGDTDNPDELALPIGNGRDKISKSKIKKGSFKRIKPVEAVWTYPMSYNALDPLQEDWYRPEHWLVYSKLIHRTRLLTFISTDVPDILKPAYAFGGISRTQQVRPYVQNWLRARQSVSDLMHAFSVWVISLDMWSMGGSGNDKIVSRLKDFKRLIDNKGILALNKDTEEWANVSAPLQGLAELLSKAQEQICSASRIPVVEYTGIQPAGLNASSQGELTVWNENVHGWQEILFRPHLQTIIDLVQLNVFGDVDEDIVFEFEPLAEMTALEKAQLEAIRADTDSKLVTEGIISQEEVRQRIADDPDSGYNSIDVSDVPGLGGMPDEVGDIIDPEQAGGLSNGKDGDESAAIQ